MLRLKELLVKIFRFKNVLAGLDSYFKKDISLKTITFGNKYASWTFYPDLLNEKSIIYCFGVGDDISFDLAIINMFDANVCAFDPTPKSVDWVAGQNLPKQFNFFPVGLANFDGKAKFSPPENPNHISATMVARPETHDQSYKVEVKTLKSIMTDLGHKLIDLLKMDIEGAEYQVIDDMISKNIKPVQILIEFHHRFKVLGAKKTREAVKKLRENGYLVFNVSENGEEISFILGDVVTPQ